jgi:hypothetical protein
MARLRVPRSRGRPRTRPDVVLADKAYSSRAVRAHLRQRGIRTVIPVPADQKANRRRRGSRGGRPPPSTAATIYLAGLHIAGIFLWSAR